MADEDASKDNDLPRLLSSWPRVYAIVVLNLVFWIIAFVYLTETLS